MESLSEQAGGRGQDQPEGRTLAGPALQQDRPAVELRRVLDDRQAQPGAAGLPGPGLVDPVETLEHLPLLRDRDPYAGVAHNHRDLVGCRLDGQLDPTAGPVVFDGVIDQVGAGGLDQLAVSPDHGVSARAVDLDADVVPRGELRLLLGDLDEHLPYVEGLLRLFSFLRFEPGQGQQVLDDVGEPDGLTVQVADEAVGDIRVMRGAGDERLDDRPHVRHRRTELMGDVGHEVAPHALQLALGRNVLKDADHAADLAGPGGDRADLDLEGPPARQRYRDFLLDDLPAPGFLYGPVDSRRVVDLGERPAHRVIAGGPQQLLGDRVYHPRPQVAAQHDYPDVDVLEDRLEPVALLRQEPVVFAHLVGHRVEVLRQVVQLH